MQESWLFFTRGCCVYTYRLFFFLKEKGLNWIKRLEIIQGKHKTWTRALHTLILGNVVTSKQWAASDRAANLSSCTWIHLLPMLWENVWWNKRWDKKMFSYCLQGNYKIHTEKLLFEIYVTAHFYHLRTLGSLHCEKCVFQHNGINYFHYL